MALTEDVNDLGYWYPRLVANAPKLPMPSTTIVRTDLPLLELLDGNCPDPAAYDAFLAELQQAGDLAGWPCFLRTGHTSGKHDWAETCDWRDRDKASWHVHRLVEYSACADMFGLPLGTWAVRERIPVVPLFHCQAYGGMPVVPEWRLFVDGAKVVHTQPYWPHDALAAGRPTASNWLAVITGAEESLGRQDVVGVLESLARAAVAAVGGGYWSVDLLWSAVTGSWWLTDMADGARSYRYEP